MLVLTNSSSLFVGLISIIAVCSPTLNNPCPLVQVVKNEASPSLNLNTSCMYFISDLSCAKNNFVSDDVNTAFSHKNLEISERQLQEKHFSFLHV